MLARKVRSLLPVCLGAVPPFKGKGRLTLLLDRLLTDADEPSSYVVLGSLNGGVPFYFDLRPWGQKFAYYYREWEKEYIDVLRRIYRGGCFVDVGSSIGLYVTCLGPEVRRVGGSILSFEPVPYNLKRQQRNVGLNNLDDVVTYFPWALGSESGKARVKTDPAAADNNAFIVAGEGDLDIDVVRLDDIPIEEEHGRVGLIKLDIEGYEPMAIAGAAKTIERDRPILFAEFCRERMEINGFSVEGSWDLLVNRLSYTCYILSPRDKRLYPLDRPADHENLFFIPGDVELPADLRA